jgi:capsule polysaccharide export protein KpsE/RkpR
VSIRPLFAAMAVLALAGCANDPAPNEQMRLTEQAITQAKAVGATADEMPEMKLAEDKFNRAKGNMADESYKNARMRSEQAELDARLAEAKVLTQKSEEQLNVLNTRIIRLRKQLGDAQ